MRRLIAVIFFLVSFACADQSARDASLMINLVQNEQYDAAKTLVEKNGDLAQCILQFIHYKQHEFDQKPLNIASNQNELIKFFFHTNQGLYWLNKMGDQANASAHFDKAILIAKSLKLVALIKESYRNKLRFYDIFSNLTDDKSHLVYLREYEKYLTNSYDSVFFDVYQLRLTQRVTERTKFVYDLNRIIEIDKRTSKYGDPILWAKLKVTKASIYFNYENNVDSAFANLASAKNILKDSKNLLYQRTYLTVLLNEARYNMVIGNLDLAQTQLNQIKLDGKSFDTEDLKRFFYWRKWKLHEKLQSESSQLYEMDSALFYQAKYYKQESDVLYERGREKSAADLSERQEQEKKELQETINYWILVSALIILFGGSLSYFTIKSSKRKRLLALQEKELETQKNLTLLKEQEITTINAMVEGQEKERKRVAEDLHDNLGNVIATLKMHFENLRINQERKKVDQETLFNKTEGLIDEAYQKVRTMAHAKNAGVIANQGLLVAVKLMAEKISSANTIQIEVIDYGMERHLENSLEISLFRIIQELTTNIIKHAQAHQATINISQDEEDITILIEDNGIGMNTSQIDMKKGMGLHSIKTRVEHLDGDFTIDSTPSKGTTIIIQIPN